MDRHTNTQAQGHQQLYAQKGVITRPTNNSAMSLHTLFVVGHQELGNEASKMHNPIPVLGWRNAQVEKVFLVNFAGFAQGTQR
mmetsp:Transcript_82429/g.181296  ORF Transcript_82429/g.181296 Transcript_82429/m.181296 type:complete len:83 (-) Transcript_82429:3-251(-)